MTDSSFLITTPRASIFSIRPTKNGQRKTVCGFTLIEVLVVSAITALLAGLLVTNFSRTRSALPRFSAELVSATRQAQSLAISGVLHEDTHRCGYGVAFLSDRYIIFAGPDATRGCGGDNFRYDVGEPIVAKGPVPEGLVMTAPADAYFQPPLPTTYLNGAVGAGSLEITLRETRASCPSSGCRTIIIDESGHVQVSQ